MGYRCHLSTKERVVMRSKGKNEHAHAAALASAVSAISRELKQNLVKNEYARSAAGKHTAAAESADGEQMDSR